MSIIDTGLTIGRPSRKSGLFETIVRHLRKAIEAAARPVIARIHAMEAREKLRRLSDHHLADIGLSRADIERQFPDTLYRDPTDSLHRFRSMVNK